MGGKHSGSSSQLPVLCPSRAAFYHRLAGKAPQITRKKLADVNRRDWKRERILKTDATGRSADG